MVLIDGGSTRNFVDPKFVAMRNIPTRDFGGFDVEVAGKFNTKCMKKVSQLELKMGNYSMAEQ